MNPRPTLPWRSGLLLAGALALAVPLAALWLDGGEDPDGLLVLAPSSLATIERELDEAMNAAGVGPIEWVFGGSQSLVAQVADGVPADVVVVADVIARDAVIAAEPSLSDSTSFASNTLVFAVAPDNPARLTSFADLAEPEHLLGICAIDVPCGRLAATALADLGVTAAVDTEETSVRALTTKITSGELDGGLIYRTDALAADLDVIDEDALAHFGNDYYAMSTEDGRPFVDLLRGSAIADILAGAGFTA